MNARPLVIELVHRYKRSP